MRRIRTDRRHTLPGTAPRHSMFARIARGLALMLAAAGPAMAQEAGPSAPEVFAALLRQAPTLTALDGDDRPLPDGATEAFITRLLAELTLGLREPALGTRMDMACVPADPREGWVCRIELRLGGDTLRASHVAGYYLTATPSEDCPPGSEQPLDSFPAYRPCAWTIPDGRIWLTESG